MSLPLDKKSLRIVLLQQRDLLSHAEIATKSAAAQAQLIDLAVFQRAETLALYSPIRNEIDTECLLLEALAKGKRVCYPRVSADALQFYQVESLDDLQPGRFGICEPRRQSSVVDPAMINLMVVPGVAFDRQGHRLGYGRGYYDRLLQNCSFTGLSIGFGYSFQVHVALPVEEHDQKLSMLVTEDEVFSPS